ncbi:MAG: hypothetical protein ABI893_07750 [Polaromonas sp.]
MSILPPVELSIVEMNLANMRQSPRASHVTINGDVDHSCHIG